MAEIKDLKTLVKSTVSNGHVLLVTDIYTNTPTKFPVNALLPTISSIGAGQTLMAGTPLTNNTQFNFKSLASIHSGITVTTVSDVLSIDLVEENIDLALCDNTTSLFLTAVDLAAGGSTIVPVVNGGTGLDTLAKGAMLYANEVDSIAALSVPVNGQVLIGNTTTDVPEWSTLTAGTNIEITESAGAITIASSITTQLSILDMSNFNIDLGTGYISSDGTTSQGIRVTGAHTYLGDVGAYHDSDTLNIGGGGIRFSNNSTVNIKPNANTGTTAGSSVRVQAGDSVDGNAANLELRAGSATGTGSGGSVIITGGRSTGGSVDGDVSINTYTGASEMEGLKVLSESQDVEIMAGDLRITNERKGLVHPGSGIVTQSPSHTSSVTMNTTSGIITLATVSLPADTSAEFQLTNSTITERSLILLTVEAPEGAPGPSNISASIVRPVAGSASIRLFNSGTGATENTTWKVNFLVINI
jgi:hypothetical protein